MSTRARLGPRTGHWRVCQGDQRDGFIAITCGREERVFRVPTLGVIRAGQFLPLIGVKLHRL
ncbi:MAG: hypothetical protein VCC36_09675 [Gammaproteobacteria bacterium]